VFYCFSLNLSYFRHADRKMASGLVQRSL